jgi:HSP20 family molecular chaperone IbpA
LDDNVEGDTMSEENEDGQNDQHSEKSATDEHPRGFHLEAGLRPLSDLLGNLVEVNMSNAPPPSTAPGETVEWADTDTDTDTDEPGVDRHGHDSESGQTRTDQVRESTTGECLIDTRLADDELIITADIPGARKDEISLGRNPRTNKLVISKDGTVVGRVKLPWKSPETTKVWFNNGVLEIRMQPAKD